ncbi:DUF1912 family protein [Streptococcus mutans]|uniref:DUF1912 family protein n=1 Tax=Streptococcus mutans TaxID=1309 RepID=UPI00030D90EC|nr:DUF1912 family protein [Streptococcus mutans]
MSYEQEFLQEFEAWVNSQVTINEMAMNASRKIIEEDKDERAADAYIRYESNWMPINIQGKFENYKAGKGFHDIPDGLFGERNY